MARNNGTPSLLKELTALLPPGVVSTIAAVISMILSSAILVAAIQGAFFSHLDSETLALSQMACLVVFTLLIVHPTFMVTRGKRWPTTFLKQVNHLVIAGLMIVLAWNLWSSQGRHAVGSLIGLMFAVIAYLLYRSRVFQHTCYHYQKLWGDLKQWHAEEGNKK